MPLSNSVLRRYTPPTCTLEIAATSSPLSRWAGKSITKDLRFELRFDDPRQPEEERVTIRGNAQDLEMLSDAVNNYIQNFLNSSTELPLIGTTNGNSMPDHPPNGNGNTGFTQNVNTFEQNISEQPLELDNTLAINPAQSNIHSFHPRTAPEIHLQPKGLLSHELFFGDLATAESGLTVALSVLQLFDLATALDEYAAELVALPKQNNPLAWKKAPPAWTSAAAMVLLAVGVTGGIAYFNQQNQPQTTALKTTQPTPGLTPLSPLPVPVAPVVSPLPTPVVPPSLATVPNLPPPTPVTTPAPGTATLPPGNSSSPNTAVNSSPTAIAIVPRRPTIPGSNNSGIPSIAGAPSVPPRSPGNSTAGTTPTQPPLPKAPTTPPALNLPTITPTPAPESATTAQVDSSRTRSGGSVSDSNPAAVSAPSPNAANNKLLDTIPQVAEARNYLQSRWKPPANFSQTLEYRLNLGPTGSIDTVDPLGQAAAQNIDVTGIPKPGEQFVSPVSNGTNAKIRVVFKPDGTVSTFLEQ